MSATAPIPPKQNIQFNSADIGNKPAPDLFADQPKPSGIKALFAKLNKSFLFRGWHKFLTIAIALLLVAAAIATPIVIQHIANQSAPQKTTDEIYADRTQLANDIYRAATAVNQGDTDSPYFDALAVFDDAILEHTDIVTQNEIRYKKSEFLHLQGDYTAAIAILLELKADDNLENYQRSKVYFGLMSAYHAIDDLDEAQRTQDEYNELSGEGAS